LLYTYITVKNGAQRLVAKNMRKLFLAVILLLAVPAAFCIPRALAQPPYSAANFTGTWGFGASGTVIFEPPETGPTPNCDGWTPVSLPIAIVGTLVGDGMGGLTGTQTFNADGLICSGTLKGTYTVIADGTGKLTNVTFTPAAGSPALCATTVGNTAFAFSNVVNHIDLAGTDCFQVISGSGTKQ
jgi:hypothetical protein